MHVISPTRIFPRDWNYKSQSFNGLLKQLWEEAYPDKSYEKLYNKVSYEKSYEYYNEMSKTKRIEAYEKYLNKDSFCEQIDNLWVNQNIVFNSEEMEQLKAIGFEYIPREFFGKELREVAE